MAISNRTEHSADRSVIRRLRGIAFGLAALAAAVLVAPTGAEAGSRARDVSDRLDRLAYQVDQIRDTRSLRKRDRQIDRLQSRLYRLERINDRYRGRRARLNDRRIDRLQRRLARMERRVEARLDRRYDRRGHGQHRGYRDRGYRQGHWPYGFAWGY